MSNEQKVPESPFDTNSEKFGFEIESTENGFILEATDKSDFLVYRATVTQKTVDMMGVPQRVEMAKMMLEAAIRGETPDELRIAAGFVEGHTETETEGTDEGSQIARLGNMKPKRKAISDFLVLKLAIASRFAQEIFWYELPVVNHEDEVGLLRLKVQYLQDKVDNFPKLQPKRSGLEKSKLLAGKRIFTYWLESQLPNFKFQLIFRASEVQFSNQAFHSFCDYRGPVIVLVKASHINDVFGGYSFVPFGGPTGDRQDFSNESFLFTEMQAVHGEYQKFKVKPNKNAIYTDPKRGPCFGFVNSGFVDLNINKSQGSTTPHQAHPQFENVKDKSLCGQQSFTTTDYEVFVVTQFLCDSE